MCDRFMKGGCEQRESSKEWELEGDHHHLSQKDSPCRAGRVITGKSRDELCFLHVFRSFILNCSIFLFSRCFFPKIF